MMSQLFSNGEKQEEMVWKQRSSCQPQTVPLVYACKPLFTYNMVNDLRITGLER